jgi:hypothetical protein
MVQLQWAEKEKTLMDGNQQATRHSAGDQSI